MADRLEETEVTDPGVTPAYGEHSRDANGNANREHYRDSDGRELAFVTEESVRSIDPEVSDAEAIDIVIIRTDIEQTRHDISETLDALKEKLSPQVLLDQAKEHAREVAVEAIDNARETVQENIVATVSGVQETVSEAMHTASDAVGATVHNVTDSVSEVVEAAKERVSEAIDTARERVGSAIDSARQTVTGRSQTAQSGIGTIQTRIGGAMEGAKSAGTSLLDTAKRNPIPTALIGVGALYLVLKHQDENRSSSSGQPDYDYTDFSPLDPSVSPIDPALGSDGGEVADVIDPNIETDIEAGIRAINEGPRTYGAVTGSTGNGTANSGSNFNPVGGLIDLIQKNPLPAALTIFGASWLFFQSREPDRPVRYGDYADYSREYTSTPRPLGSGTPVDGVIDSVKQTAGQVGETVGGAVNSAKDAVGGAAGTVRDKIGETAGAVRDSVGGAVDATKSKVGDAVEGAKSAVGTVTDKAAQVGGQAREQVSTLGKAAVEHTRRAGTAVVDTYHDNPMAYGLVVLGIGAAVGLLLPGTDPENRLLGQKRDELMGQAQSQVQDLAQKVQTVAGETFETARSKAVEGVHAQGLA